MRYFLLIYDPYSRRLISEVAYQDASEAMREFAATEQKHRGEPVQVLMFSADSIETVHSTHPHYFGNGGDEDDFGVDASWEPRVPA